MAKYTIKNGDTLSQIAAAHGTTVAALAKANGISDPNRIYAGASLTIPGSGGSGGGSSKSAAKPAAKKPTLNMQVLAEQYGFSAALLNSNPELKTLFKTAVAKNYDQAHFTAALYNTKWYKTHSDTYRNAIVQKSVDPKSYAQKVSQQTQRIVQAAGQMGAKMSKATLENLSEQSYMLGWDDNQLRAHLASYITFTGGNAYGQAGQYQDQLNKYAGSMGVNVSSKSIDNWVQQAAAGKIDINDAQKHILDLAVSKYPALAQRLRQGETIDAIADPYKQEMATILGVDPDAINNTDKTIQGALSYIDPTDKKKTHVLQTMTSFDDTLRADPRWKTSQNAQDATASLVSSLGAMFGKTSA